MGPRVGEISILAISVVTDIDAGARGSVADKALCYKPEGHGFKTR
jgi:hypothetical protein